MKWRHTTRGTTLPSKVGDISTEAHEEDDHFTSSSEGEDADIDVDN